MGHVEETPLERTMRLLSGADNCPAMPERVRDIYRLLGDCLPRGHRQEELPATWKQLKYITHLAALSEAEANWWLRSAHYARLDLAQAGHIIGKLRKATAREREHVS